VEKSEQLPKNFRDVGDHSTLEPLGKAGAGSPADFEKLLASFDLLPKGEKKPFTTLLEIAKFPHSELACSNILAFFLDPNEEHKLGTIVLNSLLEAAAFPERISAPSPHSVEIIREERTDTNKSIDLVIISGSFVVGIENKIYAEAYNPFEDYKRRLEEIAKKNKIPPENVFKILLSLKPETQTEDLCGFKPLMYDKFFSILRANIGQRMLDADQRCWIYLVDFITTIQNLRRQYTVNKELLDFFKAHEETALKFYLELRNLEELLRSKTERVAENVKRPEGFPRFWFWSSLSDPDETYIYHSWCCDTEINGVPVRIEVIVYINRGWEIVVWSREGGDFSKVCKWLEDHKIPPVRVSQSDKHWFYEEFKDPDLSLAEEKVGAKFQELLEGINKARGPKEIQTLSAAQKRRQ